MELINNISLETVLKIFVWAALAYNLVSVVLLLVVLDNIRIKVIAKHPKLVDDKAILSNAIDLATITIRKTEYTGLSVKLKIFYYTIASVCSGIAVFIVQLYYN